jgi:FkbH-like protein
MWETDWASPPADLLAPAPRPSSLDPDDVESAYALLWMEHCIECAIPDCYSTCPLYVERRDRKCARLRYGIHPNPAFRGLFEFGADVHFRRWGKLESKLSYGAASPRELRRMLDRDRGALTVINAAATALEPLNPKRTLNGAYRVLRDRIVTGATSGQVRDGASFDAFVAEVYNPNDAAVMLVLEIHDERLRHRVSLPLAPGWNLHRIPYREMAVDLSRLEGRILVYPENDAEVRLIFTWLDFVRYTPAARDRERTGTGAHAAANAAGAEAAHAPTRANGVATASPAARHPTDGPEPASKPAAKVKVVAWDLDHTLWRGILVEDGAEALVLNPLAIETVKKLDERGILNTILSKNDRAPAWAKLTEWGIQEYFVSPAINWGRKSANLTQIAEELNLNLDAFALVDDSAFERAEVSSELPQVRVFADTDLDGLLERPEFDVPVTDDSRRRRFSYLAEDTRKAIAASYGDDYAEFLRSCGMVTRLFQPVEPKQRSRALELIQRSNQLNLSTRRYTPEQFDALLADPEVLALAWSCKDRYGDYGAVGFLSVSLEGDVPVLRDLVISCRVAKKKVENALFQWLADGFRAHGRDRLEAAYLPTSRNHVLLDSLSEVGFVKMAERDGHIVLELPLRDPLPDGTIVTIDASSVRFPESRTIGSRGAAS